MPYSCRALIMNLEDLARPCMHTWMNAPRKPGLLPRKAGRGPAAVCRLEPRKSFLGERSFALPRSASLPRASPAARAARTRRLFRPTDCAEARPGRRRTRTPRWRRDGVAREARGDRGSGEEEREDGKGWTWKERKEGAQKADRTWIALGVRATLPQQSQITRPHPCPTHGRKRAKIRSANLEH